MTASEILKYLAIVNEGDWEKIYSDIKDKRSDFEDDDVRRVIKSNKSKMVSVLDPEYPDYLKQIYRPPFVLFYYGDISLIESFENCVSVVGSRECSEYGKTNTKQIVKDLCDTYTIVSGLAEGIDLTSHKAAIENKGRTVAILGTGIDICYPKDNYQTYNEIKEHHLLLSEYPGKSFPQNDSFPFRNRLIAALSKGLIVTEASMRSGTSITVRYALEFGKDIMAVPYPTNANSACNRWIQEGANLIESGDDVRKILG